MCVCVCEQMIFTAEQKLFAINTLSRCTAPRTSCAFLHNAAHFQLRAFLQSHRNTQKRTGRMYNTVTNTHERTQPTLVATNTGELMPGS